MKMQMRWKSFEKQKLSWTLQASLPTERIKQPRCITWPKENSTATESNRIIRKKNTAWRTAPSINQDNMLMLA